MFHLLFADLSHLVSAQKREAEKKETERKETERRERQKLEQEAKEKVSAPFFGLEKSCLVLTQLELHKEKSRKTGRASVGGGGVEATRLAHAVPLKSSDDETATKPVRAIVCCLVNTPLRRGLLSPIVSHVMDRVTLLFQQLIFWHRV